MATLLWLHTQRIILLDLTLTTTMGVQTNDTRRRRRRRRLNRAPSVPIPEIPASSLHKIKYSLRIPIVLFQVNRRLLDLTTSQTTNREITSSRRQL